MRKKMRIAGENRKRIQNIAAVLAMVFVFGTAAHARVRASTSTISFGNQSVGATSVAQTVVLTNFSMGSVSILSASISGPQFSYSGPSLPVSLAGKGGSGTFSVTFQPSAAQDDFE